MSALETVARAIDPGGWNNMPEWPQANRWNAATAENCLRRQRKANRQAGAAIAALRALLPPEAQAAVDAVMREEG